MVANKILKRKSYERAYSSIHEMYHKVVTIKTDIHEEISESK